MLTDVLRTRFRTWLRSVLTGLWWLTKDPLSLGGPCWPHMPPEHHRHVIQHSSACSFYHRRGPPWSRLSLKLRIAKKPGCGVFASRPVDPHYKGTACFLWKRQGWPEGQNFSDRSFLMFFPGVKGVSLTCCLKHSWKTVQMLIRKKPTNPRQKWATANSEHAPARVRISPKAKCCQCCTNPLMMKKERTAAIRPVCLQWTFLLRIQIITRKKTPSSFCWCFPVLE